MKQKPSARRKRGSTKSILLLPDLEHARTAVLSSLTSSDAQRGYRQAIDEFVDWYCSEPRLAFNRTVVLRYRSHLESCQLAPGTINTAAVATPEKSPSRMYGPPQSCGVDLLAATCPGGADRNIHFRV